MPIFFGALAKWLAASLGLDIKRSAFKIGSLMVFLAYLAAAVIGFFAVIATLLQGVSTTMPATAVMVWGWVMPANTYSCLAAIISARIARAVYDFTVQAAKLKHESI